MSNKYFVLEDQKTCVSEIEALMKDYAGFVEQTGLRSKWFASYKFFYGKHFSEGDGYEDKAIVDMGEEGELKGLAVNHYRNFINHTLSLTTSQKPSWQCRALNTDLKSLQQTKLGNTILDSYFSGKRVIRQYKLAAEYALLFAKGFTYTWWEKTAGRPYTVVPRDAQVSDDGSEPETQIIYEGDVMVRAISPLDYFMDPQTTTWEDRSWECIKRFKNKYDLAARFADSADEILATAQGGDDPESGYKWWSFVASQSADQIPVFEFYHKRSDAVPNGRYILFLDANTILYDGPIPYQKLPCDRILPGEIHGTSEGYSDIWDLMPLQEAYNVLISSVYTNQQAFGVQNILIPRTANLSVEQLSKGLSGLKYDPQGGEPKALQLTASPPEVFQSIQIVERLMETISGVNSVARGNPEQSIKSGVALALVQSMAVQYASKFQESWAMLLEDGGTKIFDLLKLFAKTERIAEMSGRINKGRIQSFTSDDLDQIQRVAIELGNPMQRTVAGKVQIADSLLEKGLIQTPQEYLNVMETGNLDPMIEGPSAELDLIRGENELMMDGKFVSVRALVGDKHLLHTQEHRALLSNPLVRMNQQITAGILAHIQEHKELYDTQDPFWSQISGEPPSQAHQDAPPPPQVAGGGEPMPDAMGGQPGLPSPPPKLPPNAPLPPNSSAPPMPA